MPPRVVRHAVTQPIDKPYRFIPLTQGQTAIVDVADYEWLSQWPWRALWSEKSNCYRASRSLPTKKGEKRKNILMHRQILGCSPDEETDHRDRNQLNNRRENLRKCTSSQNKCNIRHRSDNTSGYKGVTHRTTNSFSAGIGVNGTWKRLGHFRTAELAARAYDKAARELHGEFATLNFPD